MDKPMSPSERLARRIEEALEEDRKAQTTNPPTAENSVTVAAKILAKAGVRFVVRSPLSYDLVLDAEECIRYLGDPVRFISDLLKVAPEQYLAWKSWRDAGHSCRGFSKNELPCERKVKDCNTPALFVPGITDRCHEHRS